MIENDYICELQMDLFSNFISFKDRLEKSGLKWN